MIIDKVKMLAIQLSKVEILHVLLSFNLLSVSPMYWIFLQEGFLHDIQCTTLKNQ